MSDPKRLLFSLRLPAQPLSVSVARRLVRCLEGWVDDEIVSRAELIVSEIVTNAIRHGSDSAADHIEMDLEATSVAICVRVRDTGEAFSLTARESRPGDTGGFGLRIAGGLADSISLTHLPAGNEVRFSLAADLERLFEEETTEVS